MTGYGFAHRYALPEMCTGLTFIGDMERGVKVPSLTTVIRLAIALDCNVTDLVDVFNKRDLRKLVPKR